MFTGSNLRKHFEQADSREQRDWVITDSAAEGFLVSDTLVAGPELQGSMGAVPISRSTAANYGGFEPNSADIIEHGGKNIQGPH